VRVLTPPRFPPGGELGALVDPKRGGIYFKRQKWALLCKRVFHQPLKLYNSPNLEVLKERIQKVFPLKRVFNRSLR